MVQVETSKPVAYDSPDHVEPWGTADNNTKNPRFNRKLFDYLPPNQVKLLDIGCSGGGLVKSVLDDGAFAVGIEGSDYSKKIKRAEWATIPDHLFTADATVPFKVVGDDKSVMQFNVITAWEFFEHIAEDSLGAVLDNMKRHLAPGGIILASIAGYEDVVNGVRLHQTVQDKAWWEKTFASNGLTRQPLLESYFNFDMVRGEPFRYLGSFTVALTRQGEALPYPEKLRGLMQRNKTYEMVQTARWLGQVSSIKYVAWAAKRYAESLLPNGRNFPRHPFSP